MNQRLLLQKAEELGETERSALAGQILSSIDPSAENLQTFWHSLEESVRGELASRVPEFEKEE